MIGAYGYPGGNAKGRSYVVFGGPGLAAVGYSVFPVSMAPMVLNSMVKTMMMKRLFRQYGRRYQW